jgi:hypothetical protein
MPTLPYLTTPGNLTKALESIKSAATPEKVSQDYVKTILGIAGGSGDNLTTFLRRIGFVGSDGTPTRIYMKFRNPKTSGAAAAEALRHGYAEIFKRNEFAYNLSNKDIKGHIIEITGSSADARNVSLTVSTFSNLNKYADFTTSDGGDDIQTKIAPTIPHSPSRPLILLS